MLGVRTVALSSVLLLVGAACGDGSTATDSGRLSIVVTHSILGDVVGNVVGDGADVSVLMPRDVDPHAFEPSARQVEAMRSADLVVANGLGLEPSLTDVLADAEDDGARVLEMALRIDPIPFAEVGADDDEGEGSLDPHFWTDPLRVARAVRALGEYLSGLDDGTDWEAAAGRYAAELEALDAEIRETLSVVPADDRKLVTNHEVFGYFAARYEFEVLGVVIPGGTTLAEPNARDLAELAETLEAAGVRAIFGETTQANDLAETLRSEAGVEAEIVELFTESLGPPGSPAATYVGMMRTNAERIAAALS